MSNCSWEMLLIFQATNILIQKLFSIYADMIGRVSDHVSYDIILLAEKKEILYLEPLGNLVHFSIAAP